MMTTTKTLKKTLIIMLIISMMISLVMPFSSYAKDDSEEIVFEVPKGEEGLQIGDYIYYNPDSYNLRGRSPSYGYNFSSGSTGMGFYQRVERPLNLFGMWKVIGYSDTTVDVIPVYHLETNGLWLSRYGYLPNVAEDINDALNYMYTYEELGIEARSVQINDFFKYLTDEAIEILFEEREIKLEEKYLTNPAAKVLYHNEEIDLDENFSLDTEASKDIAFSNKEEAKLRYCDNSYWIVNPDYREELGINPVNGVDLSAREMKQIMREYYPLFKLENGVLSVVEWEDIPLDIIDGTYGTGPQSGFIDNTNITVGMGTSAPSNMDIIQDYCDNYLGGIDKEDADKYIQYNFLSPVLTIDKEVLESDDERNFTVIGEERVDIPVINIEYSEDLLDEIFDNEEMSVYYNNNFMFNLDTASLIISYLNNHEDYKYHVMTNDAVFGLYTDEQCTNLVSISKPFKANNEEFNGLYVFEDVPNSNYYIKQLKASSGYKLNDNPANFRNLILKSNDMFNYTMKYFPYEIDYNTIFYGVEDNGLASLLTRGEVNAIWRVMFDIYDISPEYLVQILPFMAKYLDSDSRLQFANYDFQYGLTSSSVNLAVYDIESVEDLDSLSEEQREELSNLMEAYKDIVKKYMLSGIQNTNYLDYYREYNPYNSNILELMHNIYGIYVGSSFGDNGKGVDGIGDNIESSNLSDLVGKTRIDPEYGYCYFVPTYFFNEKVEIEVEKLDENGNRLAGAELAIIDPETNEIVKQKDYSLEKDEEYFVDNEHFRNRAMNAQTQLEGNLSGYIGLNNKLFEIPSGIENSLISGIHKSRTDKEFYAEFVVKNIVNISEFLVLPKTKGSINLLTLDGPIAEYGYDSEYTLYENTVFDRGLLDLFGVSSSIEDTELKWTTDDNAKAIDYLTEGKEYILRELKAPDGYKEVEDIRFTVEDGMLVKLNNELTETKFSFYVEDEEIDVPGAVITIYDGDTLVERFTSEDAPYVKEGLVEGKEYTIKVESVPEGLVIPEDMQVTIEDGMHIKVIADRLLTNITVVKVDEETDEVIKAEFEFTIYSDEACTNAIATAKTNSETGKATFEDLPYGTYYIKETKAAEGYVKSDKVEVIVIDSSLEGVGDNYEFTFGNKPVEVILIKKDERGNILPGAKLQVLAKENDEVIDEYTSENTSHRITHIIEGKNYILRELKAPEGYDKAEDIVFTAKDGKIVEMIDKDKLLTINVQIVDKDTKNPIRNQEFKLEIYTNEELTDKAEYARISYDYTKGTAKFENLPYDEYYIVETKSPKGYIASNDVKKVVYNDDLETNNNEIDVTIENEPVKMALGNIEGKTKQNVIGAEIEVYDIETNELVDRWTTKNEVHTIKNLEVGRKYVMKQVYVPDEYYPADDIEFIAKNGENIIMKNEKVLTTIIVSLIDEDSSKPIVNKTFGFRIYKDEECRHEAAYVRINTGDATATILELEKGTYYIRQVEVPDGYEPVSDKALRVDLNRNLDEYGNILNLLVKNKAKKAEPAKQENKQAAQPAAQPQAAAPAPTTVIVQSGKGSGTTTVTRTASSDTSTGKVDPDTLVERVKNVPDTESETNLIFYNIAISMLVIGLGLIVVAFKKKEN